MLVVSTICHCGLIFKGDAAWPLSEGLKNEDKQLKSLHEELEKLRSEDKAQGKPPSRERKLT